jgi:hypothetical protein
MASPQGNTSCEPILKKIKTEPGADEICVKLETAESDNLRATTSGNSSWEGGSGACDRTVPATMPGGPKPFAVQVLGRDVLFQRLGKVVLLKTASVLELAQRQLPLLTCLTTGPAPVSGGGGELDKTFISWNAFRHLLTGWFTEVALSDLLRHYRFLFFSDPSYHPTDYELEQRYRTGFVING